MSKGSVFLPAGQVISLTADSNFDCEYWYDLNQGYGVLSAGSNLIIGPFDDNRNYEFSGGRMVYVVENYFAEINSTANVASSTATSASSLAGQYNHITPLSASGAITVFYGINKITKSSAAADLTLAAPSAGQEGSRFIITSQTAKAHTITATSLLNAGDASSPYTTATFAAYVGAGIELIAINQMWNIVSSVGITLS